MSPVRRYAEWRPVAVRRIPAQWIGMALGALTMAPALFLTNHGGYFWLILGGFVTHQTTTRVTERRLRNLRDDPEGEQFAVTLRLRREVDYGFDEGLLAFLDGWLVYSGRQCSFSVRREDVLDLAIQKKGYGFLFQGSAGRHAAFFGSAEEGRLRDALIAWVRAKDVPGAAVLPPLLPNAEARTLHRSWIGLGLLPFVVLLMYASMQTKPHRHLFFEALAFASLPLAAIYGIQAQRAFERIAAGLPYRRNRLARHLGIRLMHPAQTTARSASIKSQLERAEWAEWSMSDEIAHLEAKRLEAEAGRTRVREMLDAVRENAFPASEKKSDPDVWAPDADGVLRPKGRTP